MDKGIRGRESSAHCLSIPLSRADWEILPQRTVGNSADRTTIMMLFQSLLYPLAGLKRTATSDFCVFERPLKRIKSTKLVPQQRTSSGLPVLPETLSELLLSNLDHHQKIKQRRSQITRWDGNCGIVRKKIDDERARTARIETIEDLLEQDKFVIEARAEADMAKFKKYLNLCQQHLTEERDAYQSAREAQKLLEDEFHRRIGEKPEESAELIGMGLPL